jgi:hypothetical protein
VTARGQVPSIGMPGVARTGDPAAGRSRRHLLCDHLRRTGRHAAAVPAQG